MSTPEFVPAYEQEEIDAAANEAAKIGGVAGDEALDEAERPVREGGGGEAEGFEEAEAALVEHATHGDQQSAHAILHDQGAPEDALAADRQDAEADFERTSEREDE